MTSLFISAAPMEGVIDPIMRHHLTEIGGLDQTTTEFVRVTDKLLSDHVFFKYAPELANGGKTQSGIPVFIQLLGGQPGPMAENALKATALGSLGIDINFGCPAKTVNRHDGGAAILKNPRRVFEITHAIRKAIPSPTPVTVKVRLGYDDKSQAIEIAQAAEEGGALRLTVHARTKVEMYRPPAHWDFIALIRERLRIPVVANGDIWTPEDFKRCQEITGCTAFALGRGLIARPTLALEIKTLTSNAKFSDLRPTLKSFYTDSERVSEKFATSRIKQWLKLLSRNHPEANDLFEKIKVLHSSPEVKEILFST